MNTDKQAAIVTGASSGIGYEISKKLLEKGFEVFGIGRKFTDEKAISDSSFHMIECDITDTDKLIKRLDTIIKENNIYILVNNAGVGYYGLHEELNASKIKQLVRTNLEAPIIITNYLLRVLKENKGWIFNISSVTATQSNPHGAAYGATKAGLSSFSRSLFDEARKYGVKVVNIQPDMTATELYRNANFKEDMDLMAHLNPEEVANILGFALEQRDGLVITDFTIKPQLHRIAKK